MSDTQFEDAENYSMNFGKDKLQFKDIIFQHLHKISQFASVEFRGGYWEEKAVSVGGGQTITNRIYVPDTREVYSNAVECFADMLYPHFDKKMKEAEEKAQEDIDKAFKDNSVVVEETRTDETPEEAKRYFKDVQQRRSYRDMKLDINRKLFRELCCFLYRKKYLELGSIED